MQNKMEMITYLNNKNKLNKDENGLQRNIDEK